MGKLLCWLIRKLLNPYLGQLVVYKPRATPSIYKQLIDLGRFNNPLSWRVTFLTQFEKHGFEYCWRFLRFSSTILY